MKILAPLHARPGFVLYAAEVDHVDEALVAYFVRRVGGNESTFEPKVRQLFTSTAGSFQNPFIDKEITELIAAIDGIKILDHACGSGAFPMGALHRLVDLLTKLDPHNARWKRQQLERARADRTLANQMQDEENRENALRDVEDRIQDIEHSSTRNSMPSILLEALSD